jgi:hypothetical protein
MTWKSTAVVSGAGLLATWLASYSPSTVARQTPSPRPAATSGADTDIVREADRLQTRVRAEVGYREPSRNLFRFGQRTETISRPRPVVAAPSEPAFDTAPEPPIAIKFSGIASDAVDGREQRTAILSTPGGLVFAREGDDVAGGYKVRKIAEDAVELVKSDGTLLHLR